MAGFVSLCGLEVGIVDCKWMIRLGCQNWVKEFVLFCYLRLSVVMCRCLLYDG